MGFFINKTNIYISNLNFTFVIGVGIFSLLIESMRDMVRAKHVSDESKYMYATIRTLPINK